MFWGKVPGTLEVPSTLKCLISDIQNVYNTQTFQSSSINMLSVGYNKKAKENHNDIQWEMDYYACLSKRETYFVE
jgi:hypothetical protein